MPEAALLPENVLLVTLNVPLFWMPPPSWEALLPAKVQLVTVRSP